MKKLFFAFLFLINISFIAKAEFTYSPLQIILKAEDGHASEKMVFYNPSNKPIRLQLSFSEWEIDNISQIKILNNSETINYIKANPQQFTLLPTEEKEIKITCLLPSNYDDREYKLFLNILEIARDRKAIDFDSKENKNFVNKQIRAGTYIRKGNLTETKRGLKIEQINVFPEKNFFKYEILYSNTSSTHTRQALMANLYDSKNNLIAEQNLGFLVAFPTEKNSFRSFIGVFPYSAINKIKSIEFDFKMADLNKKVQF